MLGSIYKYEGESSVLKESFDLIDSLRECNELEGRGAHVDRQCDFRECSGYKPKSGCPRSSRIKALHASQRLQFVNCVIEHFNLLNNVLFSEETLHSPEVAVSAHTCLKMKGALR